MEINITGKNIKISTNIRDVINKKIQKVIKNFSHPIDCNIILTREKNKIFTEVIIMGDHGKLYFKKSAEDVYSSIENAINTADLGVKKFKEKQRGRKHREGTKNVIEKVNTFRRIYDYDVDELKPISVEEAFLQMKYMKKNFILFINAKTEKYNVMFKDKNETFVIAPPSGIMAFLKKKRDILEKMKIEYKNNKVRVKKKEQMLVKELSISEAIKRINRKNRFYIFKDTDSGKIQIIFQKDRNSYWRVIL